MSQRIDLSSEKAEQIGVRAGALSSDVLTEMQRLRAWFSKDPWCAPLVISGGVEVFDFTEKYDAGRKLLEPYGIGRYNEDRRGMYEAELFTGGQDPRTIHMGIDIGAAEGTPIFSPLAGEIWGAENLLADGDYGGTLILKFRSEEAGQSSDFFMLFGHLSRATVARWSAGAKVEKGDLLGWLGGKSENGGWNPHLHWQLSRLEPLKVDLPGAVSRSNHEIAKLVFPDPTELLRLAIAGWR